MGLMVGACSGKSKEKTHDGQPETPAAVGKIRTASLKSCNVAASFQLAGRTVSPSTSANLAGETFKATASWKLAAT
jgi:hypothetical protein